MRPSCFRPWPLRSRHLVVVANLREQIVGQIAAQPLSRPESVFEVAAALDYEQRRRDMLKGVAAGGAVLIDCEPSRSVSSSSNAIPC